MSHVGQCPACHNRYELEASDVGHLLECECGATLFACPASAFSMIPVRCDDCHEVYEVESCDAGQVVECECGQTLTVPTVIFRLPIGASTSAAAVMAAVAEERAAEEQVGDLNEEQISGRDSSAVVERWDSAHISQRGSSGPGNSPTGGFAVATQVAPSRTRGARESRSSTAGRSHSRSNRGTWMGIGAVAVFLLFAIGMFLFRQPPSKLKSQPSAARASGDWGQQEVADAPLVDANSDSRADPDLVAELAGIAMASPKTTVRVAATTGVDAPAGDDSLGQFPVPPSTLYALPKKVPAKTRVPVSTERIPRMTLGSGVRKAFDAYEKTQALEEKSAASGVAADVEAYRESLGKTLALVEYVHQLAMAENDQEQINTVRYLLSYLYYSAGHLANASVLGEAVARWGDKEEPSTKEAAMIALGAAQEMSESHWGSPEQVGELAQMEAICSVLAKRWPEDSQLDLIWMNLAYLYEAFNFPEHAIDVYKKLKEGSTQYADAQIASGLARWRIARRKAIADSRRPSGDELKLARQELSRGLRKKEQTQKSLSSLSVAVRLALAQVDLLLGQNERAEQWLVESPASVFESIRVVESNDQSEGVVVSEAVARQLFDALFFIRQQAGDATGATEVLSKMAEVVESSEGQVEARRLSIVKRSVDRLKDAENVSAADVQRLQELAGPMLADESSVPTANLLWLGESWSEIGLRTGDQAVAQKCAAEAALLYGKAMLRTDFPTESQQTAQLRRIELLRRSGKVLESLNQLEDVLAKTPNVFSLQIEAAESLQQLAFDSGRASDLNAAIKGPEGFSSIWGWGKLVTSLHAARWSDTGTDEHVDQLYRAQYSLGQCRYLLAMQSRDVAARGAELSEIERSIRKILATMDKQNLWYAKFSQLLALVSKAS